MHARDLASIPRACQRVGRWIKPFECDLRGARDRRGVETLPFKHALDGGRLKRHRPHRAERHARAANAPPLTGQRAAIDSTETPFGFIRLTFKKPKSAAANGRGTWIEATRPTRPRSRRTSASGRAAPLWPAKITRAPSASRATRSRHRDAVQTDCRRRSPCCGSAAHRPHAPPAPGTSSRDASRSSPW